MELGDSMHLYQIIKNEPAYWLVDQVKVKGTELLEYRVQLERLLTAWESKRVSYLSLLMDEGIEGWLVEQGFHKVSSIVEYTRSLAKLPPLDEAIQCQSLAGGAISDLQFQDLYAKCRSGSANKNKQQPMDEVMKSLESELGRDWRSYCYYFLRAGTKEPLGISIPHIEADTVEEGRLFYFGVLPEVRGQGLGTRLHTHALHLLKKEVGASYYVGSTDKHNTGMIRIFEKNGCHLRDQKGIYRIDRNN